MLSNVEPVRDPFEAFCLPAFAHMACFLFHPRVIRLSALTRGRSKFCPSLIPKALTRAIVTKAKANSRLQLSRWPGTFVSSVRIRKLSSKASRGSRILKILKFFYMATGLIFWTSISLSIALYATGKLRINKHNPPLAPRYAAVFQVDSKVFAQGGSAMKEVMEEMTLKSFAVGTVWDKLRNDEAFKRKFGDNVLISGYKLNQTDPTGVEALDSPELFTDDKERNTDSWKVCFYIDGSNSSGLVTMVFHKVNTDNIKWIPVSLLVETLPNSGVKICDISAPLPNGITKFTRLLSDD